MIRIDPESRVPLYAQIVEQIQAHIAAGQLTPGDQLPTIRQLAADLRINFNTVVRAYLELEREGLISTQRGRGTFVADSLIGDSQGQATANNCPRLIEPIKVTC